MFTGPRGPANGPSGSLRATCCTARLMDPPRVCCWERYPPGRPRKRSWRSCAACWTNIKRGHDDHHCTPGRNAAGQGSRLDPISLAVGRRAGRAGPAGGAARHALAARALCMRLCGDARRAGGVRRHILCPRAAGEGARRGRSAHDPARGFGRKPSVARHAGAVPHGGSAAVAGALLDVGRVAPSTAQRCRLDGRGALAPARRLRLSKPVALLETCLADVPVVIGYLRPVILAPVGLLAGMPASQVEAILMHEWAINLRNDYLSNLLQMVVESFLFYAPGIWWMPGVVRYKREKCCDY